jgi:hypothetical protein
VARLFQTVAAPFERERFGDLVGHALRFISLTVVRPGEITDAEPASAMCLSPSVVIVVAFTITTRVAGGADRYRPPSVRLVPVIVTAVAPGVISEAMLKSVTSTRAAAPPSLRF